MPRALWLMWAAFTVFTSLANSETLVQSPLQDPGRRLKLLYVMEYDGKLDWQPVQLEKGLTDDVLAWLISLHDRLTMTIQRPLGEELMASRLTFRPAARSHVSVQRHSRH